MNKKNPDRMRALRPLGSRDYRLLFAAVAIEVFGTGMWTIVMVFQVLELNDSPLARCVNDAQVVTQHAFMGDITYQNAGAMFFGKQPLPGYL